MVAGPVLLVRSLFAPELRRTLAERQGLGAVGDGEARGPSAPGRPRVLLHAVSVGEVRTALPLVRLLERDCEVVVSTTTATGREVALELYGAARVERFPFDGLGAVSRFWKRVRPDVVLLVELELWPRFLEEARRRGVPVAVVNGRITERSARRYARIEGALGLFGGVDLYCAKDDESAQRFAELCGDSERVVVTGSTKADVIALEPVVPTDELRHLVRPDERPVLVGGSTHAPEEGLLTQAWREALADWRLVLAPRHPPRVAEVVRDLEGLGAPPQLLTALRAGETPDPARPLVVDTVGELLVVYALADLAFVGGSFGPREGQNLLEPASQGVAVVHGPRVANFREEAALLGAAGAAFEVALPEQLAARLAELARDPGARQRAGAAGQAVADRSRGATERVREALRCLAPLA